jgi:dTDP-4-dehydrorhamnose reductase
MPADGKKCTQVEAISTPEYPTPTKRPAYSVLSCDKLERVFGVRLPHWEDSLKQVLET